MLISNIEGFMPSSSLSSSILKNSNRLFAYIAADSADEDFDTKQGGVGLAEDNAILMIGKVDRKGVATATDLKLYTTVSSLDDITKVDGVSIICQGNGVEVYQDPGQDTEKNIILSPLDAVSNALSNVNEGAISKESKKICINFTGGDDLMVHEVLEAVQNLVSGLDLSMENSIEFKSLCDGSFPPEKCSVVALSVAGGSAEGSENVYWHEGKWWTLLESNLNTAEE